MMAKAWDWVTGLDEMIWAIVGIGLVVVVGLGIAAYIAGRQRNDDAEVAVRERVESFAAAVAEGKGGAACEMLTNEAAADLAQRVDHAVAPAGRARSCEQAVRVAASQASAGQTEGLRNVEVLEVDYDEEWTPAIREDPGHFESATATARLRGRDGEVELRTEDWSTEDAESWTIDSAAPVLELMVPAR
jgi:hypothetical protein